MSPEVAATGEVLQPTEVLHAVAQSMPVAVLQLDAEGVVRAAMGAALEIPSEHLVGTSLLDVAENEENRRSVLLALAGQRMLHVGSWGGRSWQCRYEPLADGGVTAVYLDVTAQVEAEQARAAADLQFRSVLDATSEAIAVSDARGSITWTNPPCAALLDEQDALGSPLRPSLERLAREVLDVDDTTARRTELRLQRRDGSTTWLLVSARRMARDRADGSGAVLVLTDISANKSVERRLEVVALTDTLTGAASRLKLLDRLEHALQHRSTPAVAVLFCDVDGLKVVNDTHGHEAGDAMLRAVATRIRSVLRLEDTLGRIGGDEFVVVTESIEESDAHALRERVAAAVSEPLVLEDGTSLQPSVSIGVALAPPQTSARDLLAAADQASYAAKRARG